MTLLELTNLAKSNLLQVILEDPDLLAQFPPTRFSETRHWKTRYRMAIKESNEAIEAPHLPIRTLNSAYG
jgi:hypothetical protein